MQPDPRQTVPALALTIYGVLVGCITVAAVVMLGMRLSGQPDVLVTGLQGLLIAAAVFGGSRLAWPALRASIRRWPWLLGDRFGLPASHEFAVDVDGETLVYRIDEGPDLERLKTWCAVHGLEPQRVVVPQTATVRDGYLSLELYEVDVEGRMRVDPNDTARAARTTASVRLMDNPPDCWVRREEHRHAA